MAEFYPGTLNKILPRMRELDEAHSGLKNWICTTYKVTKGRIEHVQHRFEKEAPGASALSLLSGNASLHQGSVCPSASAPDWSQIQFVRIVERSRRPRDISQEDIRVGTVTTISVPQSHLEPGMDFLLHEINRRAQVFFTRSRVPSTGLSVQRLSLVLSQPIGKGLPSTGDVVPHTLDVLSRVIIVEVLVHVKDEVRRAAVHILDCRKRGCRTANELSGRAGACSR